KGEAACRVKKFTRTPGVTATVENVLVRLVPRFGITRTGNSTARDATWASISRRATNPSKEMPAFTCSAVGEEEKQETGQVKAMAVPFGWLENSPWTTNPVSV